MMIRPKKWQILGGGLVAILVVAAVAAAEYVQYRNRNAARGEAKAMLSEIMAAEEAYRAEHQDYFDVSGGSTAMHPRNKPTPEAVEWEKDTAISSRFAELMRYIPWRSERVRFAYTVFAGRGAAPKDKLPKAVQHWLPFKNDPWYIALAAGDLDGDGELQYLAASSEYDGVHVLNDD
jgi:type II secretory pathway pseudopilin PulG